MASKATNYLFGFISGAVTGIFLGLLLFLSKDKKTEKSKKTIEDDNDTEEKEDNFFIRNIIKSKLYTRLSKLSAKEADKYK